MTRSPALIQLFILLALLLYLVGLSAQAQTPPLVFIPSAPSAPPPVTFHPSPVTGAQGVTGTSATGTQGATGTPVVAGTQGTQGVQGVQGIQGIQGVPGSAGTGSDAQVINVKAFTPPLSALTLLTGQTPAQALASFLPAQGDGVHDDTLALQAAIDDAVAKSANSVAPAYQRFRVFLPAGVYKITAPLTIDRPGGIYTGFDIEGAGSTPAGLPLDGGTTIIQRGAAQDSVLWVKNGAFRDNRIANLTLMVATDTHYGIHLGSQYSRLLISRVEITVPGGIAFPHGTTGIYQELPSAGQNANGEQTVLDDVQVDYLDTLYDFRAQQAFGLTLRDCGGQSNNGGTALAVGVNDSGGYQVYVTNFSVSAAVGTLPNTLFHIGIISGNFTAVSTRSEKFDTVLKLDGGSNGIISNVTLSDSHFDSITQHASPIVGAAGGSTQYFVTMARNKFSPLTPGSAFTMPAPTDLRHDVWDSCIFEQWSSVSLGARPNASNYPFNGYAGTRITDCWMSTVAQPILAAVTN